MLEKVDEHAETLNSIALMSTCRDFHEGLMSLIDPKSDSWEYMHAERTW